MLPAGRPPTRGAAAAAVAGRHQAAGPARRRRRAAARPARRRARSAELFCSWEDVARRAHGAAVRQDHHASPSRPSCPRPAPSSLTSQQDRGLEGDRRAARRARPARGSGRSTRSTSPTPRRPGGGTRCATSPPSRRPSRLAGHFVADRRGRPPRHLGPGRQGAPRDAAARRRAVGGTLLDVYDWLADEATPVPGGLLREHGYDLLARTLRGTQDSPPETRGSVYFTARAATACLRDPQITAWVTPPDQPHGADR